MSTARNSVLVSFSPFRFPEFARVGTRSTRGKRRDSSPQLTCLHRAIAGAIRRPAMLFGMVSQNLTTAIANASVRAFSFSEFSDMPGHGARLTPTDQSKNNWKIRQA
jgi:hypothetical protein